MELADTPALGAGAREGVLQVTLRILTKQHDPDATYIEPKCPKCGLINRFIYDATQFLTKTTR